MTIAVSARIVRSRMLAALCVLMAGVLLAAGMLLHDAAAMASVCAIAAVGLALFPLSIPKACRIDVTGIGQILLTDTATEAGFDQVTQAIAAAEVVQLLGSSTLWPSLMVLRLQTASGRVIRLVLLPDSMDREAFRALSVTCRWIAARRLAA
jgi:toxin CptA